MRVFDLFCGSGGFSFGFQQAGFDIILGIDNDLSVRDTFLANHPKAEFIHRDMRDITPEILECYGPVDVLIGSPPCENFSLMSTEKRDPDKGLILVREFIRIKDALKPSYWVMENVAQAEKFVRSLVPYMKANIFDAVDFGVPQFRRRMFLGNYSIPTPTHNQYPGQLTLVDTTCSPWRILSDIIDLSVNFGFIGEERNKKLAALKRSRISKNDIVCGNVNYPDRLDKPSRTLLAKIAWSNRSTIVIELNGRRRILTLKEMARLQGFPDSFSWFGTPNKIKVMIGNAVCPPVAKAFAEAILKNVR